MFDFYGEALLKSLILIFFLISFVFYFVSVASLFFDITSLVVVIMSFSI